MELAFDIRRSVILSRYLKYWGIPEDRKSLSLNNSTVELYVFPGEDMDQVTRFATIGLSSCQMNDKTHCNSELLLVVPYETGHEQHEEINQYLLSISSYILNTLSRNIKAEDIIPPFTLAPNGWPKAILIDEPRGEPEELASFPISEQHVSLHWLIPIFDEECTMIQTEGIEAFDQAIDEMSISLVDTTRVSCV